MLITAKVEIRTVRQEAPAHLIRILSLPAQSRLCDHPSAIVNRQSSPTFVAKKQKCGSFIRLLSSSPLFNSIIPRWMRIAEDLPRDLAKLADLSLVCNVAFPRLRRHQKFHHLDHSSSSTAPSLLMTIILDSVPSA